MREKIYVSSSNLAGGFTLIEVTLVIALLAVLAVLGVPLGIDSYRHYLLNLETKNLLSVLRRAETFSMANNREAVFGVSLQPSAFVLFQGATYASRNQAYDETYPRSSIVSISGWNETRFSSLSATPSATASIILSNGVATETISINSEGTIFW